MAWPAAPIDHHRDVGLRRSFLIALGIAPVVAAAVGVPLAGGGAEAAAPFSLTFEGAHFVDPSLPGGLRHDGRFTASAPFCPAGRGYDVRHPVVEPLTVHRLHTCDDGSGSFTALMPVVRGEHGGSGAWRIIEGTGRYATLRGMGTYTGTLISGDPTGFETIVFRAEWRGVVDFDAEPPAIESVTASARKVRQRVRTYALRVAFASRDTALPVTYVVDVRAGRALIALKRGSTASGRVAVTLRIRPPRAARNTRVLLTAQDAVGNETTTSRTIRLPSR